MSEESFDRVAAEYKSLPPHVAEDCLAKRVKFIVDECSLGRYSSVLDIGLGTGVLGGRLAARGYEVTGLEPSEGMLDVTRTHHPAITAIRGLGDDLPPRTEASTSSLVLPRSTMWPDRAPSVERSRRWHGPAGRADGSSSGITTRTIPSGSGAAQRAERMAELTPGVRRLCAHNVVVAAGA